MSEVTLDSAPVSKPAKKDLSASRAQRKPVIRPFHGRDSTDNFEWLHDKESPEVTECLEAENAYTEAFTSDLDSTADAILKEIKSRVQETDMSVPTRLNGWWYYLCAQEGKSYGMSCRVCAEAGDGLAAWTPPTIVDDSSAPGEQVILDANELAKGHDFFTLGTANVSADGNLLAYSTGVTGDERHMLRVEDSRTGELLNDEIVGIVAGVTWAGSGWISYQKVDEARQPDSVWRHRVGTSTEGDVCIFHELDGAYWVGVGTVRSEKYPTIESSSRITSEVWYLDVSDPISGFACVRPCESDVEYDIDHAVIRGQDMWLIAYNMTGSNFALAMMPVGSFNSIPDLTGLVAHRDDARVEGVNCFVRRIAFGYRRDGIGHVALAALAQDEDGAGPAETGNAADLVPASAVNFVELGFDEELYSADTTSNAEWDTLVSHYAHGSFITSSQLQQIGIVSGKRVLLKERKIHGEFNRGDYAAKREWVSVSGGVQILVSTIHHADLDLDTPNPMLFYGHGSYEASMNPGLSITRPSPLDRGMIFIIAHVHDGGETGRGWQENGRATTKKNVFTDFVAVTDYLLDSGWATREQLVAFGDSVGGMLMGVVANVASDKSAGIQVAVPLVDCLTSMLMPELPLTVVEWDEWDDPHHDPKVYDYVASYASYENISADVKHPKILAITSLNDTRVLHVEPAKWIARLREVVGGEPGRLLSKTEMSASHGGILGRYERWHQTAFEYAWIVHAAGVVEWHHGYVHAAAHAGF